MDVGHLIAVPSPKNQKEDKNEFKRHKFTYRFYGTGRGRQNRRSSRGKGTQGGPKEMIEPVRRQVHVQSHHSKASPLRVFCCSPVRFFKASTSRCPSAGFAEAEVVFPRFEDPLPRHQDLSQHFTEVTGIPSLRESRKSWLGAGVSTGAFRRLISSTIFPGA
uniref:Uncharacterized protein n=1 Tax=Cannabis sativa TaxID=3483 RepID=A0A803QSL2_CANSA